MPWRRGIFTVARFERRRRSHLARGRKLCRGGQVQTTTLQNAAIGVEHGRQTDFRMAGAGRNSCHRTLRPRQKRARHLLGVAADVLVVRGGERHGVNHDLLAAWRAHASDQQRLRKQASGGCGGRRDVQQLGGHAIHRDIVAGGMNGIFLERSQVSRQILELERGGAARQPIA